MAFTFLYPLILGALLLLPLIWWLLRIIPPAAKRVQLPSLRFLHDLDQKNPPVQKTPWWILLLRLLMLALLIIGLAHPVINPQENLEGSGPLTLILDNGWSASQTWDDQQTAALKILSQAKRENRPVQLILTAPLAGEDAPQVFPADAPDQVISRIKALTASSWPGRPGKAAASLSEDQTTYWVSSGLAEQGYDALLKAQNNLQVFLPAKPRLPMILRAPKDGESASIGQVEASTGMPATTAQVRALDRKGQLIDQVSIRVAGGQGYIDAPSQLPAANLKDITRVQLSSRNGAGAVMLHDQTDNNTLIGLISGDAGKDNYNLTSPAYYISRAIEPFATFSTGTIETLIETNPGMIILADGGALPPRSLEQLSNWIKSGGILLRFATSAMIDGADALTPVPLRRSERSLQGNLTWEKPLTIKSFNSSGPFAQLALPTDIKIARQVLAEPVPDLSERTWVTLSDETPLITAKYEGKGLLVLVHTTATPDWSDLPLSGFYVQIFKSLLELTARSDKQISQGNLLQPLSILNGFGQLTQPPATLKPVDRKDFATLYPSSLTPPGFYGSHDESFALNLGDRLPPLEPLAPHIPARNLMTEGATQEINMAPLFLGGAVSLFLIDCLVLLVISGFILKLRWLLPLVLLLSPQAYAAGNDAEMASQIHLAYIKTGNATIDQTSQIGLENLSRDVIDRTAIEPGKVVGVTPGQDELIFYPVLYWPISTTQPDLSRDAASALQNYIDRGGTIIIDTRDGKYEAGQIAASAQIEKLRGMLRTISLNPLIEAPEKHVFFRTFYLLNIYPELALNGDIWIEDDSTEEAGGVSSVVLTGQDWARLWAAPIGTIPQMQKEQASRFGINAVMYALTGNYKTDQVHMNAILNRLGE